MTFVNVLPSLHVADLEATVAFYEGLFGRAPDRRPMESSAEWQLAESGGLQIFRYVDAPAIGTVILGVDDLAKTLREIGERGISAEPYEVESGYRLAELHDPAGNLVVLSQTV